LPVHELLLCEPCKDFNPLLHEVEEDIPFCCSAAGWSNDQHLHWISLTLLTLDLPVRQARINATLASVAHVAQNDIPRSNASASLDRLIVSITKLVLLIVALETVDPAAFQQRINVQLWSIQRALVQLQLPSGTSATAVANTWRLPTWTP